jgi:hypothetical protein
MLSVNNETASFAFRAWLSYGPPLTVAAIRSSKSVNVTGTNVLFPPFSIQIHEPLTRTTRTFAPIGNAVFGDRLLGFAGKITGSFIVTNAGTALGATVPLLDTNSARLTVGCGIDATLCVAVKRGVF